MSRHRSYMVTLWKEPNLSINDKIQYIIGQQEKCPTTGKTHFQGYIELNNPTSIQGIKKLLNDNTAHIEPRKGNQKQAIDYVTKLETRIEGTQIELGKRKEQGKRNDLLEAIKLIKENKPINDIINEIPQMLKYDKHLERYQQRAIEPRNFETHVTVLIGPPGSGKTRQVHEQEKDLWIMPEGTSTQWFDGYKGQEAVLIDDFNGNIRYHLLLQLLDRYPMTVNTKGGYTQWRPKRIYITSNHEIEEWYQDTTALSRRIHVHKYCTEVAGNTMPPLNS